MDGMRPVPQLPPRLEAFSMSFLELLDRWNRRHHLTALPREAREEELLLDSAVLLPWIETLGPGSRVVDFGTGMGIPALLLAAARPDLEVVAVDKVGKKLAFVRQAGLECGLPNLRPLAGRIEELPPLGASLGTAKAVAPLAQLAAWWNRHRSASGLFLALKGPAWMEELPVPGWTATPHAYVLPTRGERVVVELRPEGAFSG